MGEILKSGSAIFWLSWHRNPYNDYLFNELSKYYKLDVTFVKEVLSSHPWLDSANVSFKQSYLRNFREILTAFKQASDNYSLRVIAGWNHPIMILMIIFLSITRKSFVIWSDTPNIQIKRSFIKRTLRNIWLSFIFKNAKAFMVTGKIGVNNAMKMGVRSNKIVNFPFATDLNHFVPQKHSQISSELVSFISSGRLINSHKGFDVAIKAFGLLKKTHPELKFSYEIAGTGSDEAILKNLIISEDLESEVSLLGWIQQKELVKFYQSGDIFLHPSHFDPFPNVILEAMAVGLPVIGSDAAGSVCDRVEDGKNGFIFSDGDISGLKEILVLVLTQKDQMGNWQKASREKSLEWDVSYNISQIQSLL